METAAVVTGGTARPATMVAAEAMAGAIRSVSPSRLRNVGTKGARLGVRVVPSGGFGQAQALISGTGPWPIIEYDTKAHRIAPKRRGGKKALRFPSGEFARSADHPGTKGKAPFHKGVEVGAPLVPRVYQAALIADLHTIF